MASGVLLPIVGFITTFLCVRAALQPFYSGACGDQPVDIVFAVDTSSSIWKPDFERQLHFVRVVSNQFDLGNGDKQTRIGLVTFADTYYLQFHLWQNNRPDLLDRALQRVRHKIGRKTSTWHMLNFMRKYMFTHRYGSRKKAAHVAIVITDGKSRDRGRSLKAAEEARKAGIKIFAIGVGDGVDYGELEGLASKPASDYVFEVEDFKSLDSMKFILANKTCLAEIETAAAEGRPITSETAIAQPYRIRTRPNWYRRRIPTAQETPTPSPAPRRRLPQPKPVTEKPADVQADIDPRLNVTNCGGKPADIYFALDASNSIWPEDFKRQLAFVRDLISMFDISSQKTRVGLVTFSDNVEVKFDFNTRQEKHFLMEAVSNVTFMSGRTKTSEALRFIREQGFSRDVARREVAHIVLVFTDGLSKKPRETAREAELARREGIYVFSIGIGNSVEKTELEDIASDPDDEFTFHVKSFSVLNTIRDILAIKTCAVLPKDMQADEKDLDCNLKGNTDLMFVYDSAQLGIQKTRKITKFVYDVTSALDTTSGSLKIGRFTENCLTGADTYLTAQKPALDFDDIYFPDLRTLIRKLARTGFHESYGGRRHAKKIAVLFLDDDMENLKQASKEIERLRETHTLVVTIGSSDVRTAAAFTSRPTNDHLVHVPSYKYLLAAKSTLLQKLCKILAAT